MPELYKHVGYRVDREEVHPQFGATVYMSKHLLPVSPPPVADSRGKEDERPNEDVDPR